MLNTFQEEEKDSILAAVDSKCNVIITISDILRLTAKYTVESLTRMKTKVVFLTGDNPKITDYFTNIVGISYIKARLIAKRKNIQISQKERTDVCMIGEGTNDSSLKTINISVTMRNM